MPKRGEHGGEKGGILIHDTDSIENWPTFWPLGLVPRKRPAELEIVEIDAGGVTLMGELALPPEPGGLVLFAHGSGSSRHSLRNRHVAGVLRRQGLATLLFDLLTSGEEEDDRLRFNITLLAGRLLAASKWALAQSATQDFALGYFGAGTGSAAALVAAAALGPSVKAVVSRGGRPDLALQALPRVQSPTLLIVGGRDQQVLALNEEACQKLVCPKRLAIVPNATHLFEEGGALDQVADLAARWFLDHLG